MEPSTSRRATSRTREFSSRYRIGGCAFLYYTVTEDETQENHGLCFLGRERNSPDTYFASYDKNPRDRSDAVMTGEEERDYGEDEDYVLATAGSARAPVDSSSSGSLAGPWSVLAAPLIAVLSARFAILSVGVEFTAHATTVREVCSDLKANAEDGVFVRNNEFRVGTIILTEIFLVGPSRFRLIAIGVGFAIRRTQRGETNSEQETTDNGKHTLPCTSGTLLYNAMWWVGPRAVTWSQLGRLPPWGPVSPPMSRLPQIGAPGVVLIKVSINKHELKCAQCPCTLSSRVVFSANFTSHSVTYVHTEFLTVFHHSPAALFQLHLRSTSLGPPYGHHTTVGQWSSGFTFCFPGIFSWDWLHEDEGNCTCGVPETVRHVLLKVWEFPGGLELDKMVGKERYEHFVLLATQILERVELEEWTDRLQSGTAAGSSPEYPKSNELLRPHTVCALCMGYRYLPALLPDICADFHKTRFSDHGQVKETLKKWLSAVERSVPRLNKCIEVDVDRFME
ncbi:hypothetical protein AAG570_006176 [Ranatra chinensis]|uniref:Uncharacterized protein n=1 Tax=Ranatra chinensis TaxID=642074 RepID=A0ABD0XYA8_9HEMI